MTPTQSPTLASQATAELPKPADRAPRLHRLKTDPEVYQAVLAGHKTFEIRLNDRDFRIGDELLLMETTATGEAIRAGAPLQFTGNEMRKHVSHVLRGYGLMPGWVCLSFAGVEAGRASRAQSEPEGLDLLREARDAIGYRLLDDTFGYEWVEKLRGLLGETK